MKKDDIRGPRLTHETVARLAETARLALTPEETDSIARELSDLVDYIDGIADIDTCGAEPTERVLLGETALRDDSPAPRTAGSPARSGAGFVTLPGDVQGEGGA